ncbi:MAG TPA: hypothetical protein PL001_02065 [Candidatus Kryptobacter bacterium]|nr:MAG: hypothetical protein B7Z63_00715 [Ignavibacteriae bacterium 37-53-5]HQT90795.1 hypothetical protein [Candidatus Kryptobacter bacterium]
MRTLVISGTFPIADSAFNITLLAVSRHWPGHSPPRERHFHEGKISLQVISRLHFRSHNEEYGKLPDGFATHDLHALIINLITALNLDFCDYALLEAQVT